MHDGFDLNPQVLIQVQNSKIAEQAIRITQLEAGAQQLLMENAQLRDMIPKDEEVTVDAGPNS